VVIKTKDWIQRKYTLFQLNITYEIGAPLNSTKSATGLKKQRGLPFGNPL